MHQELCYIPAMQVIGRALFVSSMILTSSFGLGSQDVRRNPWSPKLTSSVKNAAERGFIKLSSLWTGDFNIAHMAMSGPGPFSSIFGPGRMKSKIGKFAVANLRGTGNNLSTLPVSFDSALEEDSELFGLNVEAQEIEHLLKNCEDASVCYLEASLDQNATLGVRLATFKSKVWDLLETTDLTNLKFKAFLNPVLVQAFIEIQSRVKNPSFNTGERTLEEAGQLAEDLRQGKVSYGELYDPNVVRVSHNLRRIWAETSRHFWETYPSLRESSYKQAAPIIGIWTFVFEESLYIVGGVGVYNIFEEIHGSSSGAYRLQEQEAIGIRSFFFSVAPQR